MDKRGSSDLNKYIKKLNNSLDNAIPWTKKAPSRLANLQGRVKPGEVAVVLDAGDQYLKDLYKGAKVIRE